MDVLMCIMASSNQLNHIAPSSSLAFYLPGRACAWMNEDEQQQQG
jgi:hypothetical protein